MKKIGILLLFVMVAGILPPASFSATINASVATSLTDAFKELVAGFCKDHPDVEIVGNYGASGTLAKQIAQGAPADLYISANEKWLAFLIDAKAVDSGSVASLAANRLVFIGTQGRAVSLGDLVKLKRIAIGSLKSAPVGQYAEEALKKAGLFEQLVGEGKLVQAQDVRQALVYADRGEVDGAFVYKTDALLAQSATILFEVPKEMHAPIVYPMALTTAGAGNRSARAFMEYLRSASASAVLAKFGFVVN